MSVSLGAQGEVNGSGLVEMLQTRKINPDRPAAVMSAAKQEDSDFENIADNSQKMGSQREDRQLYLPLNKESYYLQTNGPARNDDQGQDIMARGSHRATEVKSWVNSSKMEERKSVFLNFMQRFNKSKDRPKRWRHQEGRGDQSQNRSIRLVSENTFEMANDRASPSIPRTVPSHCNLPLFLASQAKEKAVARKQAELKKMNELVRDKVSCERLSSKFIIKPQATRLVEREQAGGMSKTSKGGLALQMKSDKSFENLTIGRQKSKLSATTKKEDSSKPQSFRKIHLNFKSKIDGKTKISQPLAPADFVNRCSVLAAAPRISHRLEKMENELHQGLVKKFAKSQDSRTGLSPTSQLRSLDHKGSQGISEGQSKLITQYLTFKRSTEGFSEAKLPKPTESAYSSSNPSSPKNRLGQAFLGRPLLKSSAQGFVGLEKEQHNLKQSSTKLRMTEDAYFGYPMRDAVLLKSKDKAESKGVGKGIQNDLDLNWNLLDKKAEGVGERENGSPRFKKHMHLCITLPGESHSEKKATQFLINPSTTGNEKKVDFSFKMEGSESIRVSSKLIGSKSIKTMSRPTPAHSDILVEDSPEKEGFYERLRRKLLGKREVQRMSQQLQRLSEGELLFERFSPIPNFYKVEGQIGKGCFGIVYLATQVLTGLPVALKIINKSSLKSAKAVERLEREIKILKLVSGHQYISKLFEVFEDPDKIYLVCEYQSNGDLVTFFKQNRLLSEDELKVFFWKIVRGVQSLHRLSIIHRDIKMDNLLLNKDLEPVIADFGISSIVTAGSLIRDTGGTPAYLAPEVIRAQGEICFKTDVWSLGVLLFVLAFGIMPFQKDDIQRLYRCILKGKFRFPEFNFVSEDLKDLIRHMLKLNISERYSTDQVLKHRWFRGCATPSAPEAPADSPSSKMQERLKKESIVRYLNDLGFSLDFVFESINKRKFNHITACFDNLWRHMDEID